MSGVEDLLGLNYRDLGASDILRGVAIPPPEPVEDQSYISIIPQGISFVLAGHETVSAVQLHAAGHEDYEEYPRELPHGLQFDMGRSEVRSLLGAPDKHGEEGTVLILGKQPAWDSYLFDQYRLHVQYDFGEDTIRMVTVTPD